GPGRLSPDALPIYGRGRSGQRRPSLRRAEPVGSLLLTHDPFSEGDGDATDGLEYAAVRRGARVLLRVGRRPIPREPDGASGGPPRGRRRRRTRRRLGARLDRHRRRRLNALHVGRFFKPSGRVGNPPYARRDGPTGTKGGSS